MLDSFIINLKDNSAKTRNKLLNLIFEKKFYKNSPI